MRVFEISAKRFCSSLCTTHSSQSGLERSRRLEKDTAGQLAQLLVAARARQRGVAHVVVEVEARVVDPERAPQLERREGRLLPVARDQREVRPDVVDQLVGRGRRALEGDQRAHVHVRRLLLMQERRVDRGEPVPVCLLLLHGFGAYPGQGDPATIAA